MTKTWERVTILGALAAAVLLIHPRGDFPLNDDWDFATATWNFARTGRFQFTAFTAVSLRAQVLWGALWTRLFGESFEVLRVSTLVLAAATLLVLHAMLARAGASRFARVAGTLSLAFNPVFLWASCSFHTEVPFVFASAVALYCFIRAFEDERLTWLVGGCAAVIVSWFVRQTGVAMLLAPLAFVLWRRKAAWKRDAAVLAGTIALFLALLVLRPQWLAGSVDELHNHFKMWTESTFRLPQQLAIVYDYLTAHAQSVALFFLPVVACVPFALRRWKQAAIVGSFALFFFPRVQWLIQSGHPMPYFASPYCCTMIVPGNVLSNWGIGPVTLNDVWTLHQPYPWQLSDAARLLLTYGALLGAAVLLFAIFRAIGDERVAPRLAGLAAIAAFCALLGSGLYVDRYSIDAAWMVPAIVVTIVPWERRAVRALAAALLVALALFDVMALQEYFSWHRAQWAAYQELLAARVPAPKIDGGAEPTCFYEIRFMTQRQRRKFLAWMPPREYLLAFNAMPGYRVVARHPFDGWFGLHRGTVYTLQRLSGTSD